MQSLKVLFIGNSYTYYNSLPSMISKLAEASDKPHRLDVSMVAAGEKTLEWHYSNPETIKAIRKADWDIVVLQEFSTRPVRKKARMFRFASKLDHKIKLSGARTFLYLTWARQHIPRMQEGLTEAYTSLARKLDATVAPVGIAWQKVLQTDPDLTLHKEDKSHPTPMGSYLAACVFYSTFFRTNPAGLTGTVVIDGNEILNLQENKARFLQSVAWETVREFAHK